MISASLLCKVIGALLTVEDRVTSHRRRHVNRGSRKSGGARRDLKKTVLTEGVACAGVL